MYSQYVQYGTEWLLAPRGTRGTGRAEGRGGVSQQTRRHGCVCVVSRWTWLVGRQAADEHVRSVEKKRWKANLI